MDLLDAPRALIRDMARVRWVVERLPPIDDRAAALLAGAGIDRAALMAAAVADVGVTVARVSFRPLEGLFELGADGVPAAIIVPAADDCPVNGMPHDIAAVDLARPECCATRHGRLVGFGQSQVGNAATYHAGRALRLHRDPLAWLRAGCDGVVIVSDSDADARGLLGAAPIIDCPDAAHGQWVLELFRGRRRLPRVRVPRTAIERAA